VFRSFPVEIRNGSEIEIVIGLAEEVFQMIVEGLSNIRRHTRAKRAVIKIDRIQNALVSRLKTRVQWKKRTAAS
jgi:signal transduction histidine kinase